MTTSFGNSWFFWFAMRVFHDRLSICLCASFPEVRMWNLIALIPDHCLSIYVLLLLKVKIDKINK